MPIYKKTIEAVKPGKGTEGVVDSILSKGDDLKYSITTTTGKFGVELGSISKARYAGTLSKVATGFRAAGTVAKVAAPIIEAPNSWEQYRYMSDEGYTPLAVIGATGDAVSFGHVRSIMKLPTLLKYTPLMTDETANNMDTWINQNVNGVRAPEKITEGMSYLYNTVTK